LDELPLAINLFKILSNKSYIDKKICLNETCAEQFKDSSRNYYSEIKIILSKADNEQKEECNKCNNERNCAIYECKFCAYKFCYYCLIEHSKNNFILSLLRDP